MIGLVIMTAIFACIFGVQLVSGRALVWWDSDATRTNKPVLYWQSAGAMGVVVLLLIILLLRATL